MISLTVSKSSVELNIGTPPKPCRLLFDTGSSTAFITSTGCTSESCPDTLTSFNRTLYDASASSSSQNLDTFDRVEYLGGDVAGAATLDIFSDPIGTLEWSQTFIAANESSWRWITADGFLGLAFNSITENATTNFVEPLLWDGKLDAPRFALFYGSNLATGGEQNGVLTIGGSHEDKYVDGSVVYAPLRKEDPYQMWRAPLRSVNVMVAGQPNATLNLRNGELPHTPEKECVYPCANTTWSMYGSGQAVFDTGSGQVSLPDEMIDALYYNLGWNQTKLMHGEERMECQHLNASWAISFTLGESEDEGNDVSFSVRGDEFKEPGSECMPPVTNSGSYSFALIGTPFLQRHYTVFDFGADKVEEYEPRIGFGRLKKEWDWMYQSA
jgi:saccharopepsin